MHGEILHVDQETPRVGCWGRFKSGILGDDVGKTTSWRTDLEESPVAARGTTSPKILLQSCSLRALSGVSSSIRPSKHSLCALS